MAMTEVLSEIDRLKLVYLARTSRLDVEARGRYTREFTELMKGDDPEPALRGFVETLPIPAPKGLS